METLGDRVKAEREAREWTQAELARRVTRAGFKIGQAGIAQIERRGDSEPKCIVQLGIALGRTPRYLQTGKGPKGPMLPDSGELATGRPQRNQSADTVSIYELEVHAGSGMGSDGDTALLATQEANAIVGVHTMPAASFREAYGISSNRIRIIPVKGNSMEPTLWPGQRVMVDIEDKTPSPPGIFVVWDGLALVLKFVEVVPNSDPLKVRISSANKNFLAYERTLDEAHINGRVVGVWARM